MVSQVSGVSRSRRSRGICRGKAPRSKVKNGKRGLILFDCIRSGRGPPEVEGEKNTDAHHV